MFGTEDQLVRESTYWIMVLVWYIGYSPGKSATLLTQVTAFKRVKPPVEGKVSTQRPSLV